MKKSELKTGMMVEMVFHEQPSKYIVMLNTSNGSFFTGNVKDDALNLDIFTDDLIHKNVPEEIYITKIWSCGNMGTMIKGETTGRTLLWEKPGELLINGMKIEIGRTGRRWGVWIDTAFVSFESIQDLYNKILIEIGKETSD